MHNVQRDAYKREKSPKEKLAICDKTNRYKKLSSALLSLRANSVYSEKSLSLTETMLSRSVDFYTIWNFRREILQHLLLEKNANEQLPYIEKELSLVAHGLANRNPKSYCLWYHRQWVIEKGLSDLPKEIILCKQFLEKDERNFHCWAYRRFIANRLKISLKSELSFTMSKIEQNFSNYSAWHYRMSLLPGLIMVSGSKPNDCDLCNRSNWTSNRPSMTTVVINSAEDVYLDKILPLIKQEMELVEQAVFTEPDDQACWLYQRWVLEWICNLMVSFEQNCCIGDSDKDTLKTIKMIQSNLKEMISSAAQNCRELLEMDGDGKWALVTLLFLLQLSQNMAHESLNKQFKEEIIEVSRRLVEMDPLHKGYYNDVCTIK